MEWPPRRSDRERARGLPRGAVHRGRRAGRAAGRGARTASAAPRGVASLERHRRRHRRGAGAACGRPVFGSAWSPTATAGWRRRSRAAGLDDYFDVMIDSTLVGVEKPDPAIFRAALDGPRTSRPEEALYVGRPLRRGRGGRASGRDRRPCCSSPMPPSPRPGVDASIRSSPWPMTCSPERRDLTMAATRPLAAPTHPRAGRQARASTATTAAPRSSRPRCATPAWKWSTPGCTRRPR